MRRALSTAQAPALPDKRHSAGAQLSVVPKEQPITSSSAPQLKDVLDPQLLQQGTPTKVSAKEHKKFVLRLDADFGGDCVRVGVEAAED